MQTISINFIVPLWWHKLSDKQLRYVYQLLADEFATDEPYAYSNGAANRTAVHICKLLFEVTPLTLAELLPHLD